MISEANKASSDEETETRRGHYDVAIKLNLAILISFLIAAGLEVEALTPADLDELSSENVEFNEFIQRRVDGFFKLTLKDGRVRYLHIEVQATPYKKMRWRMLHYCSMAGFAYDETPMQVVVYIGDKPSNFQNEIPVSKGLYDYTFVTLYETPSDTFLSSLTPEVWAYALLGAHKDSTDLVRRILTQLRAHPDVDETRRSEIIQIMDELAGLRPKLHLRKIIKKIHRDMEIKFKVDMRDSLFFQEGEKRAARRYKKKLNERLAAERLAAERLAAERLAAERLAAERLAAERRILKSFFMTLLETGFTAEAAAQKIGRPLEELLAL